MEETLFFTPDSRSQNSHQHSGFTLLILWTPPTGLVLSPVSTLPPELRVPSWGWCQAVATLGLPHGHNKGLAEAAGPFHQQQIHHL